MKKELDSLVGEKSLLLHACCAPCASTCMEKVRDKLLTTVYFYNPNITSKEEYTKRNDELVRLITAYNLMDGKGGIDYLEGEYEPREFISLSKGLENCPERGERCLKCYENRILKTGLMANEKGFDYFSTTLTLSPLKDVKALNEIGFRIAEMLGGAKWLPSDFKKEGGYQRSIELSKEYNLYRQDFCGCAYSKAQREREKSL